MNKGKEQISLLAMLMTEKGITHVVVSPGSRNAPVIIILSQCKQLNMVSIADERSAGFYALGIALTTGRPVALVCTSGSASLNYAPAIAEAYYQKVPLLVITADRPEEWIDQGDGQTIRQEGIFANYIRKSYQLPVSAAMPDQQWYTERLINEAIDRCLYPAAGPVHINLPLAEPLYNIAEQPSQPTVRNIRMAACETVVSEAELSRLTTRWNNAGRKMILTGQLPHSLPLQSALDQLAQNDSVIVLTETTSNLYNPAYIGCIDRVIDGMDESATAEFRPDILLTFGGAVVSKKIKSLIRKMKPAEHWHTGDDPDEFYLDTYQSLTLTIPVKAEVFAGQLAANSVNNPGSYRRLWHDRSSIRKQLHNRYTASIQYSDFQVYDVLFNHIPVNTWVHLSNSTPVRYAQLFDHKPGFLTAANRGTSGIDGCVSTAAGAASVSADPVTVISGDIGFLYDSNALWNQQLDVRFRIVLINNGGGNIFRILEGPADFPAMEPYIETVHPYSAEGLVSAFGLNYFRATDKQSLLAVLDDFYDYSRQKAALLEIFTPNIESAKVLKDYFKFLNA
jgi:2-succinyl-5-enolpyruvyl-6-hydroxy-3-cyclohexene-1-carboxylate synthase